MLDLFLGPGLRGGLKVSIAFEDVAKINCVVAAVELDHAGGLDNLHQLRIELGGLEILPGDIVQGPMLPSHEMLFPTVPRPSIGTGDPS